MKTIVDPLFRAIREKRPLVHCITNSVTTNFCANGLLAVGASPVMAHALQEMEEVVCASQCIVINIGTLDPAWMEAAVFASKLAAQRKIPLVLDPVGAGFTRYRTEAAHSILGTGAVAVLRGNRSEIAAMAGASGSTRGVDSDRKKGSVAKFAAALTERYGCTVCTSGEVDVVYSKRSDGTIENIDIRGGHVAMTRVTGTGCLSSALVAAALGAGASPFSGASEAMKLLKKAGLRAADRADGPGTLAAFLLDELASLSALCGTDA